MSEENKRASEIAEKIDVDHFNRQLIDVTEDFMKTLAEQKKNLTKGELLNLVKYIVKYPDTQNFPVSTSITTLARLGSQAKDALVATTVQVLIEEGQKQATPTFKPEGE